VVLVFAGTDPTGGAGLTADVLALASLGCHGAGVVTAVTAQDTTGIKLFTCMETEIVIEQARAVLEDMPVAAFKIGMLGNSAVAAAVSSIVEDYPDIPLIVDPVQSSGRGDALADDMLDGALRSLIIPQATLITPNSLEARKLAPGGDTLDACAQELMSLGSEYVLIPARMKAPRRSFTSCTATCCSRLRLRTPARQLPRFGLHARLGLRRLARARARPG
jgi:hydroxymethylpyrimidine/phosphomethylpyrimidine kinase